MKQENVASNENSGKAFKAGIWYVISSVVVKAIAVITIPIFARMMSTSEYGTIENFTSWFTILSTCCSLNLTYSIGRAKLDYRESLDKYIGSMQLLSATVSTLFIVVVLIFMKPISVFLQFDTYVIALLLLYLLFAPAISFVQNGYRYRYQYKQNTFIALYIALSTTILSILLVLLLSNYKVLGRVLGIVLPNVLLSMYLWGKALKSGTIAYNKEYWKYGFALSAPMVIHSISLNILSRADRIFITRYCGESDAGIYGLAYSYALMISVIFNAIAEGWLPWFHDSYFENRFDEIKINVKKLVVFTCYGGLACIALAPEAIMVFGGNRYLSGVSCVCPIVLGVVLQCIYTHYVNIELHLKETKFVSMGTIIAAALNVYLNILFIPKYGFVAAAYTTLFCYFVLLLVHFLLTRLLFKVHIYRDRFMFVAILITMIIASLLVTLYDKIAIRYIVVVIGFISFIITFRDIIVVYVRKYMSKIMR